MMPETGSTTAAYVRPLLIVAAVVGHVAGRNGALWARYGTAVFYEMILAGLAACF